MPGKPEAAAVQAAEELKSGTRARIAADPTFGRIRQRTEGQTN